MTAIQPCDGASVPEAAPESPPQRRGRPRVTSAAWDDYAKRIMGPHKSRRTIVKGFYAGRALRALDTEDQAFGYIDNPNRPRWEILAELGRLGSEDAIREAAAEICQRELKTKEAVALLRRRRIGEAKPGSIKALVREIERTIAAYLNRHPGMAHSRVRTALWFVGLGFAADEVEAGEDDDVPEDETRTPPVPAAAPTPEPE